MTKESIDFEKEWVIALPKIKNFANRRIHFSDREDLIQDARVKAFLQQHAFRSDGNFANWAISILKNVHLDHLRMKARRPQIHFSIDESIYTDESTSLYHWEASTPIDDSGDVFQQLIYELPSKDHQECLEARYIHGMRYKEIAKSLNIPVCTVRSRVHRGVKALRNLCDSLGVSPT